MKKYILMLLVFVFTTSCCMFENTPDPVWFPPQPIDSLLLGSWQCGNVTVTFSENNECFIKFNDAPSDYFGGPSLNWYVSGDVVILPGYFDNRTKRFAEYRYKLVGDELQLAWISYPFVGCGNFTMEGHHSPLLINENIFIKLEE